MCLLRAIDEIEVSEGSSTICDQGIPFPAAGRNWVVGIYPFFVELWKPVAPKVFWKRERN
jgi:hypothetical protein